MRDAALMLESLGVASVDINMGCPVRKVCNVGGGSAMMTELDKTAALVRGMVNAVKIPVTAKMRLGWDDENLTAPDLARALEDAGVAAIFVHGRTREQGFGGTVNLAGIRKVVEAVKTHSRHRQRRHHHAAGREEDARRNRLRRREHRARRVLRSVDFPAHAGISKYSVGRDVRASPDDSRQDPQKIWAGQSARLTTLPPEPPFAERVRVMCRHLDLMIEVFGEELGCRMFRKVAPWYAKRFGPCHEFNKRSCRFPPAREFHDVLENYIRWRQQFLDDTRRIAAALPPAADGRVLHARTDSKPARTNSRAERAGGSVVRFLLENISLSQQ